MAEYRRQVNPLMILRSAAFDVNPFDRAVTDANDESQHWRVITRDVMILALWVLKSLAI